MAPSQSTLPLTHADLRTQVLGTTPRVAPDTCIQDKY